MSNEHDVNTSINTLRDNIKKITGSVILISTESRLLNSQYFSLTKNQSKQKQTILTLDKDPVFLVEESHKNIKDFASNHMHNEVIGSAINFNNSLNNLIGNYYKAADYLKSEFIKPNGDFKKAQNSVYLIFEDITNFLMAESEKVERIKPDLTKVSKGVELAIETTNEFFKENGDVQKKLKQKHAEISLIESQQKNLIVPVAIGIVAVVAGVGLMLLAWKAVPFLALASVVSGVSVPAAMNAGVAIFCSGLGLASAGSIGVGVQVKDYMNQEAILAQKREELVMLQSAYGTLVSYESQMKRITNHINLLSDSMINARKSVKDMNDIFMAEISKLGRDIKNKRHHTSANTSSFIDDYIRELKDSAEELSTINNNLKQYVTTPFVLKNI